MKLWKAIWKELSLMRKFAIMLSSTFLNLPKTQGLNLIAMESAKELNRPFYSNLIGTSSSTGRAIVEDVTENRNERDAVYLNLALEGVFETAYQVLRLLSYSTQQLRGYFHHETPPDGNHRSSVNLHRFDPRDKSRQCHLKHLLKGSATWAEEKFLTPNRELGFGQPALCSQCLLRAVGLLMQGEAVAQLKSAKASKGEITASVAELNKAKENLSRLEERSKLKPGIPQKDGKIDYSQDFFARQAFFNVSGQLQVETYACAIGSVYTFGPTFRAEHSHTSRHLAEFWMVEPEIAFADLKDDMNCAKAYVKFLCQWLPDNCIDDMEFMAKIFDKGSIDHLRMVASMPFERISYAEAIKLLEEAVKKDKKFENKVEWGIDLASEHDQILASRQGHRCFSQMVRVPSSLLGISICLFRLETLFDEDAQIVKNAGIASFASMRIFCSPQHLGNKDLKDSTGISFRRCMQPVEKCSRDVWELFRSVDGAVHGWPTHIARSCDSFEDELLTE
ncbi:Asparagine--tRNA ligase, cytoplasmic 1 [Vitis vinifera]|uniref:Asparagine--tRNA ligase, cytoplasmic 1 n=1 Tax=Vitis vinifera TaxID=29760 RepID=A0A438DDE8_VITVI|nr:Asparagine--tRNA ligase, cytoplasmic 1 [Vitis vinifera]